MAKKKGNKGNAGGVQIKFVPKVDDQKAAEAEAKLNKIVKKAAKAADEGNIKKFKKLEKQAAKAIGQKPVKVKVEADWVIDESTGMQKQIQKVQSKVLGKMVTDLKKVKSVQTDQVLMLKQALAKNKEGQAVLEKQRQTLSKHGKLMKDNLAKQKKRQKLKAAM